jgi:LPPG:FO 2-phospho-L-lactate transferase
MKVIALAGGVGGAKLVCGFAQILKPGDLSVIVNTGDDFEHYGLYICPDLDTICYNLANISDPLTGWGRRDDSYQSLEEAIKLGGPDWFRIGNKDIGTHLERTRRLKSGQKLSRITSDFCKAWGIYTRVYPMTDDKVSTTLATANKEELPFQEYFVHQKSHPAIKAIKFSGIEKAEPIPEIIDAFVEAGLVVICPSNPWVSIDPILNIKGIKKMMVNKKVIAVSPIIQGNALKGPAAKMFFELGINPSAEAVFDHYHGLLSGFVFDQLDIPLKRIFDKKGINSFVTDTIMKDLSDKVRLANEILNYSNAIK